MDKMFDTLAYCLGFTSNGLSPIENSPAPSFVTKDAEDQWTLVDVDVPESDGKGEVFEYPTPPPSPKLEKSWLITPPPCFNAEKNEPMGEQNVRENLLIEHPSMFVCPLPESTESDSVEVNDQKTVASPQHKKAPTSLRRSQRRSARQAASAIAMQSRNNNHFKRINNEAARRNNKGFQKMRQILQQPRKRC